MMRLLKSSRVKTFKIHEDYRMSGTCGIWRVGVILVTSCIILKNMYIPGGEVEGLNSSCCMSMPGMLTQVLLLVGVNE